MSVLKLSKNDIYKNGEDDKKIKLSRSQISYDSAMVSDWETRNKEAYDALEKYRQRINSGGYLSADDLSSYRTALDSYVETSTGLRGIAKAFGQGEMDDDDKWSDTISQMETGYKGISDYYSQWKTEADFKVAMEQAKANEQRMAELTNGYDPTKHQQEGKAGWEDYVAYQEQKAQKAESTPQEKQWWEMLLGYLGDVGSDTSLPGVGGSQVLEMSEEAQRNEANKLNPDERWNDEQKEIFGYLWNTERQKASQYAIAVNNMLDNQAEDAKIKEIQESATGNIFAGVGHTLGAIASAPLGLADYLGDLIYQGAVGYIPQADGEITPFEYSQAVTGGVSQHLNDVGGTLNENIPVIGGKGWGDVYGLGTSIAQSSLAAFTGGGGQALVTFFGSAAASGVDDALSRGASGAQAIAYGTLSGLAEGLAENIGVDNLMKIGASNTMRELAMNILKQGAAEGLEEGITTLMNNFADQLVLQDKSNFAALVHRHMLMGLSESDAKKQAWMDMANDLAFDMVGGFVSGAVHAAPQTAYQTYLTGNEMKTQYGGSQQDMVGEALEINPDKGKNLSGSQLNRLVQQNEATLTAQDLSNIQSAAESRLAELGETGNVSIIAAALTKQASGEKLSRAEQQAIANSKFAQRVANELNPENIRSGDYSSAWAEQIDTNRINAQEYSRLVEAAQLPQKAADTTGDQVITEAPNTAQADQLEAPATTVPANDQQMTGKLTGKEPLQVTEESSDAQGDGVTRQVSTGKALEPQKIVSIEGGKAMIYTDSGTVASDDIEFGDADTDLLWRGAVSFNGITPASANGVIRAYRSGVPVTTYLRGAAQEFRNGYYNMDSGGEYADKLTPAQREIIYELGQKAAGENTAKAQVKATKAKKVAVSKMETTTSRQTKVHFDRNGRTFDAVRETALKTMEQLSAALGVEFYVFESYKNAAGELVYKDANGNEVKAPNGYYDPKDGSIHIDLNAGADGKGTMLFTIAHELTHFIKQWSPAKFKVLANFLITQYGKKGVSVEELVETQIAKANKNGRTIDYDAAFEEVVADSMEAMLVSGNVVQMMAELKQLDKTLWQKICEWFKDLVADLKAVADAYKEHKPDSVEGWMIADMQDVIVILESLYTDALTNAAENYQSTKTEKNTSKEGGEAMFSLRGENKDGIEVYETSEEIKRLPYKERQQRFLEIMVNEFRGRTAKFIRNGHAYYATFDEKDVNKNIYGDKLSDSKGWKAKINVGADGNIFELVENAQYNGSLSEKGKKIAAHRGVGYWDYFIKNVQIDDTVYDLVANVRKKADGAYVYSIQLNQNKTIEASPPRGSLLRALSGVPNASKQNVAQDADDVKEKFSDRDSSYIDAVSRGDMEAAQQMVDEAAKAAGYTVKAHHGTSNDFWTFKKGNKRTRGTLNFGNGFYFSPSRSFAENYTSTGRVIDAFLKLDNPYTVYGTRFDTSDLERISAQTGMDVTSDNVNEVLQTNGYDGIIARDYNGTTNPVNQYVIFDAEQAKSADPVTYDDQGDVIPLSQRFEQGKSDIRYSLREDSKGRGLSDAQVAYFANSQAKDSRGRLLTLYHQTENEFTVFDPRHKGAGTRDNETPFGIFMKTSPGDIGLRGQHQMELYANITNPLYAYNRELLTQQLEQLSPEYAALLKAHKELDTTYHTKFEQAKYALRSFIAEWRKNNPDANRRALYDVAEFDALYEAEDSVVEEWTAKADALSQKAKEALTQALRNAGYDGVILANDAGSFGRSTDAFIALDPTQVKNVDNLNPTSDPDIRYSERNPELEKVNRVLEKENAELKGDVSYLKELLRLQKTVTGGTKFTNTSVEAAAGQLMKYADARGDKTELAKLLSSLYEYIAKGEELTWDWVKEAAQPAVEWLQSHTNTRKQTNGYAGDILREIRSSRVSLDASQKEEAAYQFGSYNEFRKKAMGSVIVADQGAIPLDSQWQEWSSLYPNIFDPETTSTDMPAALLNAVDRLRRMRETDTYGYDKELFGQDLLRQVYDSYWNVSTLYTVADKAQKDINRLKLEHSKRMSDLRQFHKEKTAQLKAEHREALQKVKREQQERLDRKLQQTKEQYQQSREKNAENRRKAEMRKKIRRTIMDLDKLLNKGDKKRNVKEDMKGFASKALELADYIFTDHISNEELIRKGITVRMTPKEAALVKETEDILTRLYDNIGDLTGEEFARLDEKRKRNMEKLRDLLTEQRNEMLKTPVYNLFNDLLTEYASLKNSKQDAVKAAYDPNVESFLRSYIGESNGETDPDRKALLQNMRVVDMTTAELERLYYAYKMVLHSVREANKLHIKGKNESIDQVVTQIVMDFGSRKIPEKKVAIALQKLTNKLGWDYEKLYYALDRIGSEAFADLIMNVANSENIVMNDIMEAVAFRDEMVGKYDFNNWAVNKEIDREFMDNSGKKFKMTLGQLMSLYAYSRREGAWDHIEYGGFVFGEAALTNPKPADSYKLNKAQCEAITNTLTKEQKGYVEDMQKFLSETMGEKGNEVSMMLYGIKMFGEKNYFPIHIAGQFKAQAQESQAKQAAGFGSMSNAGFTHAQNPNAKAPFVLEGFNEIWADHVNEMSRYHGTVPALEDLRRVMNRSSYSDSIAESTSVKVIMENHFGKEAVAYFDNLYREANSGAITDKLEKNSKWLLSKFRKNSVAYSLSVLIQQPASIVRAYALVDKKYFGYKGVGAISSGIGKAVSDKWTKAHTNAYNEMLKYAPGVTMAKEIGGFDTATGGSIRSYLLDTNKSLKQKWRTGTVTEKGKAALDFVDNNAIANLPNVADKIAWIEIWNACKRETVAKHKNLAPNSEEFMQAVGERFTEVIRATQVYDSIFAKSPMLKSKRIYVQMLVSFMNEPNTVANMAESAVRDATRGDWKGGVKKAAVLIHSIIFTNVLKSIIYAMRDDDEDETYIEKYIESLSGGIMNDFNALNYIPLLRDVVSVAQGYDVERADMAIAADLIDAIEKVYKYANTETEDMTEEELIEHDKKVTEANWKLVESMAAFFGIPVKNIRREINGVIDHAKIASANKGQTTMLSAWDKIYDTVIESIPFMKNERTKGDKLYDAIVSGDKAYLDRLKSTYKTDSAYQSAVRNALRENDSRIHDAAQAKVDGNFDVYRKLLRQIQDEGKFDPDDIMSAIKSEESAIRKATKTTN